MRNLAESTPFRFFRALRNKLICSAATLLLSVSGCSHGCHAGDSEPSTYLWSERDAAPPIIPEDVDWSVQGRPKRLQKLVELVSSEVDSNDFPVELLRLMQLYTPLKFNPNSLRLFGLDDSSIVTIVGSNEDTVVAFRSKHPETIDDIVEHLNLTMATRMRTSNIYGRNVYLTWNDLSHSLYLFTVVKKEDESWIFVSLPPHVDEDDVASQRKAIEHFGKLVYQWETKENTRWGERFNKITPEKRNYFNKLTAYATFRPEHLIPTPPFQKNEPLHVTQSRKMEQELLSQLGEFEVAVSIDDKSRHIAFDVQQSNLKHLYVAAPQPPPQKLDQPLGAPKGPMPFFSSLAPTGTLGIVHLAFDPSILFTFGKAILPENERETINMRFAAYNDEMKFDVQHDFVENLTGHLTAFIYGFSPNAINDTNLPDLLMMKKLRKSILLPFQNTFRMVEFLDISTQLFPENFNRKGNGFNDIEYVWHDGDLVKWGVLVKDKYLIYVDSYEAYRRARLYDGTSATTLLTSGNRKDLGILSAENSFAKGGNDTGIYLNLQGVSSILEQNSSYTNLASWLHPFASALLLATSVDDRTVVTLDLTLKPATPLLHDSEDINLQDVEFIPGRSTDPRPN